VLSVQKVTLGAGHEKLAAVGVRPLVGLQVHSHTHHIKITREVRKRSGRTREEEEGEEEEEE